ncbi:MAG TPA: SDR family oxidoreductase [Bryobacteraceae bacterium]|nr:SDR family oxidoreductase [Bryobacteraceae bacterium]
MILVTGATGTNGLEIVKLLSRSGVRCRSLVRNPQKISTFSDLPFVEVVQGDLSRPESLAPALEGVDKALLCSSIGPDLVELQGNFIRAAKEAGVRHVVKFSGMDADPNSEWRFLRWHGIAERELEDSGLAFTHLQPNQFMQVYLRFQPTIASQRKFYAASQDSLVSPVDVRDIAAVAMAVLTGAGHEGKKYVITGPEALSYFDVADQLSAAIGKRVSYVDVPLEAARQAILDAGAPEWFAEGQAEQFRFRWQGRQSRVTSTIADVAGKKPTTCEEFAREYASYFRGEMSASAGGAQLPSGR